MRNFGLKLMMQDELGVVNGISCLLFVYCFAHNPKWSQIL